MKLSRRQWLGGAAGLVGAGLLGSKANGWGDLDDAPIAKGKKPKNIIFCVVDGMPLSCLTIVDHLRQINEGKRSYWSWLMDQPNVVNGLQDTRSLSSVVTDSSAASSAWGSGSHIWNGMTNMLPDKTELMTLTKLMAAKGVACGLVTTATMTHATPSGFAISCVNRDLEALIAEKYLDSGVSVFLGGGDRFYSASARKDKRDLYAEFAAKGFMVIKDRDSMLPAKSDKLLGIFSSGHVPYTVDRNHSLPLQRSTPTLSEMTEVALRNLKGKKNGFLLQVEGARVDHGGHANDLAAMINDQIAFEDAVKTCIDFAMKDGETLVIITADHATGGLTLNGAGDEYIESTDGLKRIANLHASYSGVTPALMANKTTQNAKDVFKDKYELEITDDEAQVVVDALNGKFALGESIFFRGLTSTLGAVIGNHTKTTFTSANHQSDHVLVSAYGPGSELCAGLTQNTEFFGIMCGFKGITHKNPTMTFEQAMPLYEKLQKELNPQLAELQAMYGSHEECGCVLDR